MLLSLSTIVLFVVSTRSLSINLPLHHIVGLDHPTLTPISDRIV